MPSRTQTAALVVLGLRVAYGAALIVKPESVTKRWLGEHRETDAAKVALRGLGAREVVIHGAAIASALSGGPVRPFLYGSAIGDLSDVVATVAGREGLPSGSAPATLAVAGGSAALSAAVAAAIER